MIDLSDQSDKALRASIGKTIRSASISDDCLHLSFADGTGIRMWDNGQDCCERRYMRTDDDLASFAGSTLVGLEVRDASGLGSDEAHEIQFLVVETSAGEFTCSNHNEHNGYYGGFGLTVAPEPQPQ